MKKLRFLLFLFSVVCSSLGYSLETNCPNLTGTFQQPWWGLGENYEPVIDGVRQIEIKTDVSNPIKYSITYSYIPYKEPFYEHTKILNADGRTHAKKPNADGRYERQTVICQNEILIEETEGYSARFIYFRSLFDKRLWSLSTKFYLNEDGDLVTTDWMFKNKIFNRVSK